MNKTRRTLAIYLPRILPIDNKTIYAVFKPKNSENPNVPAGTYISFSFKVEPFSKKEDFSMYTFASQFNTTNGKLNLIILDVDSLKSMASRHSLDSNSIKKAILKHLVISKAELENNNKTIVYED